MMREKYIEINTLKAFVEKLWLHFEEELNESLYLSAFNSKLFNSLSNEKIDYVLQNTNINRLQFMKCITLANNYIIYM
jgi:hypothetical protein